MGINPESIYSVIVFIGDSTFKTKMPENVTYAGGCVKYIKSKTTEIFPQNEVTDIIENIEAGRLQRGLKTNIDHVAYVKTVIESKEKSSRKAIAPSAAQKWYLGSQKRGQMRVVNFGAVHHSKNAEQSSKSPNKLLQLTQRSTFLFVHSLRSLLHKNPLQPLGN